MYVGLCDGMCVYVCVCACVCVCGGGAMLCEGNHLRVREAA